MVFCFVNTTRSINSFLLALHPYSNKCHLSVEPPAASSSRRCRSRSWCAVRRSTPPPSCTHAACGAISPQREGQPQISHKLRDKAPSNARKRRLSKLGARPLSGRVPPLSNLLLPLFTYINTNTRDASAATRMTS